MSEQEKCPYCSFDKKAPVQGLESGIPWPMHMRAYEAYVRRYSKQEAMITGGCRGGFHVDELDVFIPGWRDELDAMNILRNQLATVTAERDALQRFKEYTHKRLDEAGVPVNPEPPKHALAGCRVGDRFDWLVKERDQLKQRVAELERLLNWVNYNQPIAPQDKPEWTTPTESE